MTELTGPRGQVPKPFSSKTRIQIQGLELSIMSPPFKGEATDLTGKTRSDLGSKPASLIKIEASITCTEKAPISTTRFS